MSRSHLRTRKRGQSIVMFATMLAVFLGLMALGLDAVSLYAHRRMAQAAADMAVIGGAVELDGSGAGATNAQAVAQTIITANGYTLGANTGEATACINPYYVANTNTCMSPPVTTGGTSAALEVTIMYHAPTIFAMTMGHSQANVLGRAVATRRSINEYAVYANSPTCGGAVGLRVAGGGGTINGRVHTNSELELANNNWTFSGSVTYDDGRVPPCTYQDNNASATPVTVGQQTWPISAEVRDLHQYPCDWTLNGAVTGTAYADDPAIPAGNFNLNSPGSWWVDPATMTQLRSGVYCVRNGTLEAPGALQNVIATVTFVASGAASRINVTANNFTLNPYRNNVLMFNEDNPNTDAIVVQGSGGAWEGWFYARLGRIRMAGGGGLTVTGGIFGDTVELEGTGWSLLGTGSNSGFTGGLTE